MCGPISGYGRELTPKQAKAAEIKAIKADLKAAQKRVSELTKTLARVSK